MRSEFPLSNGGITVVDREDLELVSKYTWHRVEGVATSYAQGNVDGRITYLHVLLMNPTLGLVVDHVDRNGCHNWRANLRVCTQSQNLAARGLQSNNTTGYKGVCYHKSRNSPKKWRAGIGYNNKQIYIGYYMTAIEAALAYDQFAKELYGEFAGLNFPEE